MAEDVFRNHHDVWESYEDVWQTGIDGSEKYIFRAAVINMDRIEKTPYDQFDFSVFFDFDLESVETIVSHSVSSVNIDTGSDSTSSLIAAEEQVDQQINIVLKTGQATGERHKITAEIITDTASTIEKDIFVSVLDMKTGDFVKQPAENFLVKADFSNIMGLTETLYDASISITATRTGDAVDVTAISIGVSRVDDSGQAIIFVVKGGVDGDHIEIKVSVECTDTVQSTTKQFSRDVLMTIQET